MVTSISMLLPVPHLNVPKKMFEAFPMLRHYTGTFDTGKN